MSLWSVKAVQPSSGIRMKFLSLRNYRFLNFNFSKAFGSMTSRKKAQTGFAFDRKLSTLANDRLVSLAPRIWFE